MKHLAGPCPVCKKDLASTDDVVICPECGAPYHRVCYQQEGHCVFEDLHASGFEFSASDEASTPGAAPPPGVAPPPASQQVVCSSCNTANDSRNIFCESCGAPLHMTNTASGGASPQPEPGAQPFGVYGYPIMLNPNETIDGITIKDWAAYIGNSAQTYLMRFKQQAARDSKTGFMFSAFFLGPFYFAYRKMWGWAGLSFLLQILTTVPSVLLIMMSEGNPLVAGLSLTTMTNISNAVYYLGLGVQILCGVFAAYLYRKSAGKKIQALQKASTSDMEYQTSLAQKGGASVLGLLAVFGAILLLSFAITPFAGQNILDYTAKMMGTSSFTGPLASAALFLTLGR